MSEATVTGPPDFVGIGALGSGARWWHRLLLLHPGVETARARERELHFFDRFCTHAMTDEDVAAYHALFPRREGRLTGEWTSRYMYDAWTPLLLARAAPDARLLVLLSDPVERYAAKLARERRDAASDDEQLFMADAAGRGRYAAQLRNVLEYFDRDRVLVLQSERCKRDPRGEYARTLRFLGLDDAFRPSELPGATTQALPRSLRRLAGRARRRLALRRRPARSPTAGLLLWPDILEALRVELEPDVGELTKLVPELDVSLWPAFTGVARLD